MRPNNDTPVLEVPYARERQPPNMRMQSDAALRPQDRGFFDTQIRPKSHLDLSVRRG
jgi:hypothetical protein